MESGSESYDGGVSAVSGRYSNVNGQLLRCSKILPMFRNCTTLRMLTDDRDEDNAVLWVERQTV